MRLLIVKNSVERRLFIMGVFPHLRLVSKSCSSSLNLNILVQHFTLFTKQGHVATGYIALLPVLGIVAMSWLRLLFPKKPRERIKTDRRDALKLVRSLKSEDLTPIYVPEPEDEAFRDLSRTREAAMKDLKEAKYQLKALLLLNNIRNEGTANWSKKHLRWLTELILPHPAQQIVLQEQLQTIEERIRRLERMSGHRATAE